MVTTVVRSEFALKFDFVLLRIDAGNEVRRAERHA